MTRAVEQVDIAVGDDQLEDLHARLAATRWPEPATAAGTAQGPRVERLAALPAYWRDGYDWRRVEAALNSWGRHRTRIDGLTIDFFHVRSPEPDATPLVMTHGWPGIGPGVPQDRRPTVGSRRARRTG